MNNQIEKQKSQNSLNLSKKQNELIGTWIENETELELAQTFSYKKIGQFDKQDMTELVELMAKWKVLLGAVNEATSAELILICQFIYDNFKRFTLEDIKIAMNWAISGKIDMSFVSTKTISALYVSKALQLYEEEKKNIINKIALEKSNYERKESISKGANASVEDKANIFKELLIDVYKNYKQENKFQDFKDFVYLWLKNNKIFIPSKKLIQDAMIYGETKNRELKQLEKEDKRKVFSVIKYFESQDEEYRKKKFARQYIVMQFLDKINNLQELLSYIKIEQFKNK
jgi:hypothetical protein